MSEKVTARQAAPPPLYFWLLPDNEAIRRCFCSLPRKLRAMASPQDTKHSITTLRSRKRSFSDVGGTSVSALEENGDPVGKTQMNVDATSEVYSVLKDPPPRNRTASAPLEPEGEPPTQNGTASAPLEPEGEPPTQNGTASAPLEPEGEPPTQNGTASAPLEPEGEPPTQNGTASAPLEPKGEPPTGAQWNFNLDAPGTTLTLPPVSPDWSILKALPSGEHAILPEAMFRALENCIKRHRHDVVG